MATRRKSSQRKSAPRKSTVTGRGSKKSAGGRKSLRKSTVGRTSSATQGRRSTRTAGKTRQGKSGGSSRQQSQGRATTRRTTTRRASGTSQGSKRPSASGSRATSSKGRQVSRESAEGRPSRSEMRGTQTARGESSPKRRPPSRPAETSRRSAGADWPAAEEGIDLTRPTPPEALRAARRERERSEEQRMRPRDEEKSDRSPSLVPGSSHSARFAGARGDYGFDR